MGRITGNHLAATGSATIAMASILLVNGRWRAQVRRKGQKSRARTFDTEAQAQAWAARIEAGIEEEPTEGMTVRELIEHYRRVREELGRPIEPTSNSHYMLNHLDEDLGSERVADLKPDRFVSWARMRQEQGAGPYTVNLELSALGTVIRHTSSFLGITLPDVVGLARPLLSYGQLIGGGNRRTRKPTDEELASLLEWLTRRNPIIADAVQVAAITGLRRGEVARISWADVDDKRRAVLVRKRKHPRIKEARDEWVPLLGRSWTIVQKQDRTDQRIFPVSREALTDAVTAGVRALGIPDLRLHDMRRYATSMLRELGFDADARKAVTGHRSDEIHSRYVVVGLESLHAQYDAATQDKPQRRQRRRKAPAPAS